jgi:DNA-binding transcriptional MerR regulator
MDADTPRGNNAATEGEPTAPSGWVTTGVAAKSLGVSPRTVRWHIEQGNLEAKAQGEGVRRSWLVSIDSLQAFRSTRQPAAQSSADYRAPEESADIAAATPGSPIRELADRLVEEASRASEFRVRLELSERAESTVRAELAEERRRREEAESRAEGLRRELEALQEARGSPEVPGPTEDTTPAPGGVQAATQAPERRSWWWRVFRG